MPKTPIPVLENPVDEVRIEPVARTGRSKRPGLPSEHIGEVDGRSGDEDEASEQPQGERRHRPSRDYSARGFLSGICPAVGAARLALLQYEPLCKGFCRIGSSALSWLPLRLPLASKARLPI